MIKFNPEVNKPQPFIQLLPWTGCLGKQTLQEDFSYKYFIRRTCLAPGCVMPQVCLCHRKHEQSMKDCLASCIAQGPAETREQCITSHNSYWFYFLCWDTFEYFSGFMQAKSTWHNLHFDKTTLHIRFVGKILQHIPLSRLFSFLIQFFRFL